MKQCDRSSLSPFPISSSSLSSSFVASESDPEDSLWSDFTFDFSFLTSEDHKISPNDDNDATTVPKGFFFFLSFLKCYGFVLVMCCVRVS
jgi:hypothetical protein